MKSRLRLLLHRSAGDEGVLFEAAVVAVWPLALLCLWPLALLCLWLLAMLWPLCSLWPCCGHWENSGLAAAGLWPCFLAPGSTDLRRRLYSVCLKQEKENDYDNND